jgi:hypothetical protein
MNARTARASLLLALLAGAAGCGPLLQQQVQAPQFEVLADRPAELRVLPPSPQRPFGALAIRLWARVTNPNPFPLSILRVQGDLLLEGVRAAQVDFPLGVPLPAAGDTVIPFDIAVNPVDVPQVAPVMTRAIAGDPVGYEFVGRVQVDAGVLGRPTFGPMTLLSGTLQAR